MVTDGSYIDDVTGTHPFKFKLSYQNSGYISSANKITSHNKTFFFLVGEDLGAEN